MCWTDLTNTLKWWVRFARSTWNSTWHLSDSRQSEMWFRIWLVWYHSIAYFTRNVFIVVSGTRNNVLEHKSIIFNGDISRLEAVKVRTHPPQIHEFCIFFDPQNVVFAMYDENMVQKCIPRLPTWNSASNDVFGWWLAPDWKSRDLSRDIWQDPRVYVESMNHGCHVGKISQDMTE